MSILLESRKDDYVMQLQRKRPDLDAEATAQRLMTYNLPKKEKMVLNWILNKSVDLDNAKDQEDIEKAWLLVNRQNLDIQTVKNSPNEVLNRTDKSSMKIKKENFKEDINSLPGIGKPYDVDGEIKVYPLDETKEAMHSVRQLIDQEYDYDKNIWCLAARKNNHSYEGMTPEQCRQLDERFPDEMDPAWMYWSSTYTDYPKLLAMKNGKLWAFSASKENRIEWWDLDDHSNPTIPGTDVVLPKELNDKIEYARPFLMSKYDIDNSKTVTLNDLKKISKSGEDMERLKNVVLTFKNVTREKLDKMLEEYLLMRQYKSGKAMSSELIDRLAKSKNVDLRIALAKDPHTKPDLLERLLNDKSSEVRSRIAENPNITPEICEKLLAGDKNNYIGWLLASNRHTNPEILWRIADIDDERCKSQLIRNPNTPAELLKKFANSDDEFERSAIALNDSTPVEVLVDLAKDESDDVRESVAVNEKAPAWLCRKLAEDPVAKVRQAAAYGSNTPVESLKKLAQDPDDSVRLAVTYNKRLPIDVLKDLTRDSDERIAEKAKDRLANRINDH